MAIPLHCPVCGTVVAVPEDAAGQVWSCGQCRQQFQVPALPPPAAAPPPDREPAAEAPPEGDEDAPRWHRRRRKPAGSPYAVLVWMVVIPSAISLTILTCILVYRLTAGPTRK